MIYSNSDVSKEKKCFYIFYSKKYYFGNTRIGHEEN